MRILSREEQDKLQSELRILMNRYGLTGGYLVAESRQTVELNVSADYCTVIGIGPMGTVIEAIASQTYNILKQTSINGEAPKINDN